MKTFTVLFVLTLVFSSTVYFTTCLDNDSVANVKKPNIVVDDAGNTYMAYQLISGDNNRIAYINKLGPDGTYLWDTGKMLYSESGPIESIGITAILVNIENKNVIAIWGRPDGIWAQQIDSDGNLLWGADNLHLPVTENVTQKIIAVNDNSGGFLLAYTDAENNLNLSHINDKGDVLWQKDNVVSQIQSYDIAIDTLGNVVLTWEDQDYNVLTQKISATGHSLWTEDGVRISDSYGHGVGQSKIVSDEAGGAIVTWIHETRSEGKADVALYAQRITGDGLLAWQRGGIPISSASGENGMTLPLEPRVIVDSNGNAIITWREFMSIYAQKIGVDGDTLWGKNGVLVWNGTGSQGGSLYQMVTDNRDGAIVVWCYTPSGKNVDQVVTIAVQRVTAAGQTSWGDSAVKVFSSGYSTLPEISPDGQGGAIIVWANGKNIHNTNVSYIQKFNDNGENIWSDNARVLE